MEAIEDAIKKVLFGDKYIGSDALDRLLDRLVYHQLQPTSELTSNEPDVAALLLEGRSVSQIARDTNRKSPTISTIKKIS